MRRFCISFMWVAATVCVYAAPAGAKYLDEMDLADATCGAGRTPRPRHTVEGGPISLAGKVFDRGLGVHAPFEYKFFANGAATRFTANVGVDDDMKDRPLASVRFLVLADDRVAADSGVLRAGARAALDADLTGAKWVTLKVTDAGDGYACDHADWADAAFVFKPGVKWGNALLTRQLGILTPPESPAPRINGPSVFGVRPGHPILYRLPVTGERPMKLAVEVLPAGATFDAATGLLGGAVPKPGDYALAFTAENARGTAKKNFTLKVGNTICLTPPLGWNSWNCWGQDVTDEKMRRAADAMVASGLADHGWSYIVVDDCWRTRPTEKEAGMKRPGWIGERAYMYGPARTADDLPCTNPAFPDMRAMIAYIHAKGLKAGLYSVPATVACCWTWGSFGHEAKDAEVWADWGVDLLKYDWCTADRDWWRAGNDRERQFKAYKLMGDLLARQKRDIVYNVCNYGRHGVTEWARAAGGQYWRTNDDLKDTWPLLIRSINENMNVADAAGPGGWNDPDMLVVGPMRSNGFTTSRLTPNEQYAHMSLWAIMAAPLFIGCDLERLDPLARSLLTNDEVLDIDQDALGKAGRPVVHTAEHDVWLRPLADGSWAIAFFNRTWEEREIAADFKALGLPPSCKVRDIWAQKDLGVFTGRFAASIPGHAALLYRLRSAAAPTAVVPREGWRMVNGDGALALAGDQVSVAGFDAAAWMSAKVPGTVLDNLVRNGKLPEPYWGLNNRKADGLIPDLGDGNRTYYTAWFRTEFDLPADWKGRSIWLRPEGINYRAEIWLNGKMVAFPSGMFACQTVDVSLFANPGARNALAVKVYPLDIPGDTRQWRTKGMMEYANGGDGLIGRNVTMLMSIGWDFTFRDGIRDRNTGIWKDIVFFATGDVRLDAPFVRTKLSDDLKSAELDISVEAINANCDRWLFRGKAKGTLEIEVEGTPLRFRQEVQLHRGERRELHFKGTLANPRLWWPVNKGRPELYTLVCRAKTAHGEQVVRRRFGVREAYSDQSGKDGARQFWINKRRIFIRGTNWIPEAMLRTDDARMEAELRLTRQQGVNMVRLWGGGIVESDRFYDLCDEMGLLVWQEFFMTGDTAHPDDAALYLSCVSDQVKRIRHHASICHYVCSNESTEVDGIRELLERLDGTRSYMMQSECDGVHDGSPYFSLNPMRYYDDTASPRGSRVYGFNPEYGTAVLPTAECLREVLPEKDLWPINREAWAYRDGNNFYKSVTVHDDLVKCYGEATSLEDYCRRSQALDYHATRAIWEVWNRVRNEKGTGVLYWYNNVPLPKVVAYGWDYSLEPTPALFATQNALEPLHAQYDYLDDMVCLANDLPEPRAVEVAAVVYDFDSRKMWEKSAPVTVPAERCVEAFKVEFPPLDKPHFIRLSVREAGREIASTFYWRSPEKYEPKTPDALTGPCTAGFESLSALPRTTLSVQTSDAAGTLRVTVTNTGDKIAFLTRLALTGEDGKPLRPSFYSDNWFSLLPGESKTVTVSHPAKPFKLSVSAWNAEASADKAPVKIIFDTDMIGDYDDVGAMAVLHKLADAGECEILATVSSTHSNASAGTVELINRWYGRPDIPVGAVKGEGVGGGSEKHRSHIKYERLLAKYPGRWRHRNANDAPDANEVYRQVLAAQPNGSVTICTVGFLTNLKRLLQTPPDTHSPLDGRALVKRKVKAWYAMGWKIPQGRECNIQNDPASARYVLENWPTPIVIDDFNYSQYIYAGRKVAALPDDGNPIRDIFAWCVPPAEKCPAVAEIIPTGKFKDNVKEGHNCFDQSCVLAAVRGVGSFFDVEKGRMTMVGDKGDNLWTPDPNGPHARMTYKWPRERIAALIDDLMAAPPANRVAAPR